MTSLVVFIVGMSLGLVLGGLAILIAQALAFDAEIEE